MYIHITDSAVCLFCAYILVLTAAWMTGTEGSGSVYPIGAETVMPGLTPAAGQTMFAEFNTTYQANSLLDGQGHSAVPGFKLSVSGLRSQDHA